MFKIKSASIDDFFHNDLMLKIIPQVFINAIVGQHKLLHVTYKM